MSSLLLVVDFLNGSLHFTHNLFRSSCRYRQRALHKFFLKTTKIMIQNNTAGIQKWQQIKRQITTVTGRGWISVDGQEN